MSEVIFDNVPDDVLHAVVEFWHFKEGDHIDEGDDLVDLRAEDTTFTITSPVTGVLTTRFHGEDDEVEIGDVLAEIEEDIEDLDDDLDEDIELDEFEEEEEELPEDELDEEPEDEEFEEEEEEEDEDMLESDEEDDF